MVVKADDNAPMAMTRQPSVSLEQRFSGNRLDVLDRVLDKGIIIDAWARVSLGGIDLLTVEARVVVASVETYLKHAPMVAELAAAVPPSIKNPG